MGIRTPDLLIANETLYQLSYTPTRCEGIYYSLYKITASKSERVANSIEE